MSRPRELGWGTDTRLYRTPASCGGELHGAARRRPRPLVLKQRRGMGGLGRLEGRRAAGPGSVARAHASGDGAPEELPLDGFLGRCEPYFEGDGLMRRAAVPAPSSRGDDPRLPLPRRGRGFTREYPRGLMPPGRRRRSHDECFEPRVGRGYASLRARLETEWVPELQRLRRHPTTESLASASGTPTPRRAEGRDWRRHLRPLRDQRQLDVRLPGRSPCPTSRTPRSSKSRPRLHDQQLGRPWEPRSRGSRRGASLVDGDRWAPDARPRAEPERNLNAPLRFRSTGAKDAPTPQSPSPPESAASLPSHGRRRPPSGAAAYFPPDLGVASEQELPPLDACSSGQAESVSREAINFRKRTSTGSITFRMS